MNHALFITLTMINEKSRGDPNFKSAIYTINLSINNQAMTRL